LRKGEGEGGMQIESEEDQREEMLTRAGEKEIEILRY
jgi:hypothetical protein